MPTVSVSSWTEPAPLDVSLMTLRTLASSHAREGGKVGGRILRLLNAEDWPGLASFELDYTLNWDVTHLIACRQALAFFQKLEVLPLGIDKEAVAWKKFEESEASCKATNDLLRSWLGGRVNLFSRDVRVLERARRKIATVLGRCPSIDELQLRFGPGATTTIKKSLSTPQAKFASGLTCSHKLYASGLLPSVLRSLPHWLNAFESDPYIDEDDWLCTQVPVTLMSGRLEFVPKNAKTYRSIVVEPSLNGMIQAGLGSWISERLSRVGVNIRDQSRNAALARTGSLTGGLATLDLSSASDTISTQLVKLLVGEEWFRMLDAARTSSVLYKGREIVLDKFSSMGNGFTFPLETLIFWALTVSSCQPRNGLYDEIGVYGDDIICPTSDVVEVVRTLEFCGFSVNPDKSFVSGSFRESCGHDYYLGINVRPFYQKHLVDGTSLFTLHNYYARSYDMDRAQNVRNLIPRHLRLYGPDGYGDGHLVSEKWPDLGRTSKLLRKGFNGSRFETYSLGKRRSVSRYPGDFVSPLYTIYTKGSEEAASCLPELRYSLAQEFGRDGRPLWTLPGSEGYKRVLIYTLN